MYYFECKSHVKLMLISRDYKAISSFTAISVSVLSVIGFNAAQTGLVFLVVLASAIPGSLFASWVTKKTNPTTSMKLVLASLILLNFVGFPIISNPNLKSATWGLSICWGFLIGKAVEMFSLIFLTAE